MAAPSPALWLFDPDARWSELAADAPAERADARLVDGAADRKLAALARDAHETPVIALVDDEAAAPAALLAGADGVLTRADLAAGRLPGTIARAEARRRAARIRLARRAAELGAADATLESFGQSVSHDLRAPLRSMDGFGQALLEDFGETLDPVARQYIDRMRAATARLDRSIAALLRLCQMVRRRFEPTRVDLGALADEAIERLRTAEPGRTVRWRRDADLHVDGDRRLLQGLVDELVDNAWRFSAARDPAHIELRRAGAGFVLRDDGVGFGQNYAETILHAFARFHTEREFPGEGVGLAVVRCAVERHGGQIAARGVEGEGAAFAFTLDPAAGPPALPRLGAPTDGGAR